MSLDQKIRLGNPFLIGITAAAVLFLTVNAWLEPGERTVSLLLVLVGIFGLWKQYAAWKAGRNRRQA